MTRYTVRVGKKCKTCGKDDWLAMQGFNRCACGQLLWIEKKVEPDESGRLQYVQGTVLPDGYRGWTEVTR